MVFNYIKIARRAFGKNIGYTIINLTGLAIGMTVTILIGLWIWDEITFDNYHAKREKIAQVLLTQTFDNETSTEATIAAPLGTELASKYSNDFKSVSLVSSNNSSLFAVGDKKIPSTGRWAQPDFPDMLTLKMSRGTRNALKDPESILIAASLSKMLFNDSDPINKIIRIDNGFDMKVAGVYEDLPHNTSFYDMKFLMPWSKLEMIEPWMKKAATDWDNHFCQLFVEMNDRADMNKTTAKIRFLTQPHLSTYKEEVLLHPMNKWHLYSEFENGVITGGRIDTVYLFGTIGFFVLLLACINFMNLSTARSEKRAKEVGIRKTMGSDRHQLIWQFLSESTAAAFLAAFVSIILTWQALSWFNTIAEKQISFPWSKPVFWISIVSFILFTGILSGSYPAFYLSGFNPVKVLKGTFKAGRMAAIPRKVLVVLQFTVSITLIIGTIIVYKQVQFAKNRPAGYSHEGLISVAINTPELNGHYNALRNDLLQTGMVANMTESGSPISHIYNNSNGFNWKGKAPGTDPLFRTMSITHDFGNTVGWTIKEGHDFSRSLVLDSTGMILNEAAVQLMQLKEPVGENVTWNGKTYKVIGVIKNMLTQSPYDPMEASVFFIDYGWTSVITIKMKPSVPVRSALTGIEGVFKKYNPSSPFTYQFIDEEYARKFGEEERTANLTSLFAILAIVISCLGLFGLASFVAEQRTKEIGLRKVLGATVLNVWGLLSKEFVVLVIISLLISAPVAYLFMDKWLQHYQYRTGISWWVFILAGTATIMVTLITVSFQTIKAGLMNPVKSLRTE